MFLTGRDFPHHPKLTRLLCWCLLGRAPLEQLGSRGDLWISTFTTLSLNTGPLGVPASPQAQRKQLLSWRSSSAYTDTDYSGCNLSAPGKNLCLLRYKEVVATTVSGERMDSFKAQSGELAGLELSRFQRVGSDQSQVLRLRTCKRLVQRAALWTPCGSVAFANAGESWSLCNRRERSRVQLLKEQTSPRTQHKTD